MERLEDEANFLPPQRGQLRFVQLIGGDAIEPNVSAGREIHGAGEIEQGGLPTTASPHQSDKPARLNLQRHVIERSYRCSVRLVLLDHVFNR